MVQQECFCFCNCVWAVCCCVLLPTDYWWLPSGPWCSRKSDTLIRSVVVAGSGSRSDKMGSPCSQLPPAWLPASKPVSKLASQSIAPLCLVPCALCLVQPGYLLHLHFASRRLGIGSPLFFGTQPRVMWTWSVMIILPTKRKLLASTMPEQDLPTDLTWFQAHFWVLTFLLKQHQVLILIQGTPKADPHPLSRVILEIRFGSIFGRCCCSLAMKIKYLPADSLFCDRMAQMWKRLDRILYFDENILAS